DIEDLNITQTIVDEFEKLTQLEKLSLDSCNYPSDIEFESLEELENFKTLTLSGNNITTLPKALNKLDNLKYVDFDNNPNLTGQTLTNENLRSCYYDETSSICKAKEMDCFYDNNIKPCEQ
ncbi:hypothetical protein PIROE2DRAFT_3418, partial [Piromyces sp. E2]